MGFPGGASGKEPSCQYRRHQRHRFYPWVRKIPWRRAWQPTLVCFPGEPHKQRSLFTGSHRVRHNWNNLALHMQYRLYKSKIPLHSRQGCHYWIAFTESHQCKIMQYFFCQTAALTSHTFFASCTLQVLPHNHSHCSPNVYRLDKNFANITYKMYLLQLKGEA